MKVIKFIKYGKNKYKVLFEDSELILYEDVILKYNLLTVGEVDLSLLELIIKENKYSEAFDLVLSYIGIKMRNKKEINNYLTKKDFEDEIIKSTIERLENLDLLNEKKYIEAYINDRINLSNYGPYKIKNELINYELNETEIESYLSKIDSSIWKVKIDKLISKTIKTNKSKGKYNLLFKLKNDLFNLGYESILIDESLSNLEINENDLFEREFNKAYNKFSKKYNGSKLNINIFNYLYRRGFEKDLINSKLKNME